MIRIGRTLPPAAAPLDWSDIFSGLQGWIKGQAELERFESEVKDFFDVPAAFFLSSGKTALTIALNALAEIYPGRDEVLIPAYTCYSVPSAVTRAGLKVRLCDLNPETLDFDLDKLEEELTNPKLLCVIPGHLFGRPVNLEHLQKLTENAKVPILEDAAQAFGGRGAGGCYLGTQGDVGIFSLGRGKALSTVEGGIIITRNPDVAKILQRHYAELPGYSMGDKLKILCYAIALLCLVRPSLFWLPKALPFLKMGETIYDPTFAMRKMSSLQAGLSRGWQQRISLFRQERKKNAQEWVCLLSSSQRARLLQGGRVLPDLIRFPLQLDNLEARDRVLSISKQRGLGIEPTYPDSIDGIAGLSSQTSGQGNPVASQLAQSMVTLPIHPLLTPMDISNIKKHITTALRERKTQ